MKDTLGVEVQVGDIIVAAASTGGYEMKIGKVYAFNRYGSPMVKYVGQKYNRSTGKYEKAWRKGEAGSHVLVLGQWSPALNDMTAPLKLLHRIGMDYEGDIPSYVG